MKKLFLFIMIIACLSATATGIAYAASPNFSGNTPDNRYILDSSNEYKVSFDNSGYDSNRLDRNNYLFYLTSKYDLTLDLDFEIFPRAGVNTADTYATITSGAHPTGFYGKATCRIKRRKNNGVILVKESVDDSYSAIYEWHANPGSFWPNSVNRSEHEFYVTFDGEVWGTVTFNNGTA